MSRILIADGRHAQVPVRRRAGGVRAGADVVIDAVGAEESHLRSLFTRRPDNPVSQAGVLSELAQKGIHDRFRRGRVDQRHQWMDSVFVSGPGVVAGVVVVGLARGLVRSVRMARASP